MAATFDSLPVQRIFVDARKHADTPLTVNQPEREMHARGILRYCVQVCQIGCLTSAAPSDLEVVWWETMAQIVTAAGRPLRARVTSAAAAPLGMHACSSRVSSRSFARPVTQYDALHAVFRTMQMFVGNIYRAGA